MSEPLRALEPSPPPGAEEGARSLRLLVIVDDALASGSVRGAIAADPEGVEVEWVHALEPGLAALRRQPFDLVLLEVDLLCGPSPPLVADPTPRDGDSWLVLLGEPRAAADAALAPCARALARLAHDTLPRDERLGDALARLLRYLRRTLALRESASRYASLFRHSADGILLFDLEGAVLDANPRALDQLGYPREELLGLRLEALHPPEERPRLHAALAEVARGGLVTVELPVRRRDGALFPAEVSATAFHAGGQQLVQAVVRDLTGKRALEQRLQEVQKMEALGRLAGGVAHDLNNLLTVIQGYGALLRDALPPVGDSPAFLAEVTAAGERAATLTRQLLAFSRRQVLQPRLLDVNEELGQLQRLLRRTLGEDVRLRVELTPELPRVRIDPGQLEQVVVNLAVNARDAMPRGGDLTLSTSLAPPPAARARLGETAAAETAADVEGEPWVRLLVRDTGEGMSPEVLRHLFEPFFTTKERGKGTGLGLASVYGVVRQSGGDIRVDSMPGVGTTFEILLPPSRGEASLSDSGAHPTLGRGAPRGGETVLVVEDDAGVRRLVATVLRGAGYGVVEAEDCDAALAIAGSLPQPLALLLCDVVLPDRSGIEIARRVTALCPQARVLFMSGHAQEALARHGRLLPGSRFLPKPFGPDVLLAKVARTLSGRSEGG